MARTGALGAFGSISPFRGGDVSFGAFDESGGVLRTGYQGNIFEPQPRYLIKIARDIVGR